MSAITIRSGSWLYGSGFMSDSCFSFVLMLETVQVAQNCKSIRVIHYSGALELNASVAVGIKRELASRTCRCEINKLLRKQRFFGSGNRFHDLKSFSISLACGCKVLVFPTQTSISSQSWCLCREPHVHSRLCMFVCNAFWSFVLLVVALGRAGLCT